MELRRLFPWLGASPPVPLFLVQLYILFVKEDESAWNRLDQDWLVRLPLVSSSSPVNWSYGWAPILPIRNRFTVTVTLRLSNYGWNPARFLFNNAFDCICVHLLKRKGKFTVLHYFYVRTFRLMTICDLCIIHCDLFLLLHSGTVFIPYKNGIWSSKSNSVHTILP